MPAPTSRAWRPRSWLFTVIATLATAAQLVVALVPLAEGRVARTLSAHVEAGGTRIHVAHNEATCASCQARSIHGTTSRLVPPLPETVLAVVMAFATADRDASASVHPQAHPRAPPAVI
jgi:hypothetical protein